MSYLVLARKYRPQTFEQVVGQDHITNTLRNAIRTDRVAHALLFAGPRGVGKTSVARIMAKAMTCQHGPTPSPCDVCQSCKEITEGIALDVFEIDGASNRGINEIRELRENIKYMPSHSRFKIYIIDEVHMLTAEAFNALLKTLEEPPAHVLFLFATTEAHKIPITILSRCQRHNFKRIGLEDMVRSLKRVCQELPFNIAEEGLRLLAREAGGSMRDALSLLDQVMAYSEGEVTEDQVLDSLGAIDRKVMFDLSSALLASNVIAALDLLEELYNYGHDLKRVYRRMLSHFRHLVLVKMGQTGPPLIDVPIHDITLMKRQVEDVSLESVNQLFAVLFEGEAGIRLSAQPKLALEALFIKLAQFKHLVSFDQILQKLDHITKRLEERCGPSGQSDVLASPKQEVFGVSGGNELSGEAQASSDDVGETWQQLLSIFHERCRSLVPSLEKAVLSKVAEDFLEIRVHGNSFYTARLQDKKSLAVIQKVCKQFFGRNMTIKIIEAQDKTSDNNHSRESDRARRLKKEALSHPIVVDTLEVFQGRVVDVKIL
jgi:DNA polymerase-3 subunit gamma/tau